MSLQTNVFENGRWVTRNLDPYHVRAQHSRREEEKSSSCPKSSAKAPSLGILTRTLVGSSVIKQIIPARIRHKTKNDVLFICAGSIVIKEAFGNYTLKKVIVKNDFDAPIRSARIMGDPREADRGDRYNSLKRDTADWENEKSPIEVVEERSQDDQLLHTRKLPPHILVLTLASSKIVFMCSLDGTLDQPRLLWNEHPLPAARWPNEQLGEYLAVDPKSRAMAVAAHEGGIYIYALKPMDVISKDVQENSGFQPIKEERLISLDGTIMKMEFLHPSQNDLGQVILLLIVFHKGKTRIVWYEWSSNITLRESQMQANRYILPPEEQQPLLLIPLTKFTAFTMICERQVTVYKDILTGTPSRFIQSSLNVRKPEEPGSSKRLPLWTQWARPMRPAGHPETRIEDAIYLCREDGIVQYLEFQNKLDQMLDSTHQAGSLGAKIDTAFAILDVGPNTVDLLVAGGSSSEGGLWSMWPREDPRFLNKIGNWAPLHNLTAVQHSDKQVSTSRGARTVTSSQRRLFACAGEGKHGVILELRYGLQASAIFSTIIVGDTMRSGVLGVWAFHGSVGDRTPQSNGPDSQDDRTYILIAHPTQTSLLRVRLSSVSGDSYQYQQLHQDPGFLAEEMDLDLSTRTIYAATTAASSLVLVTQTSIIVLSISLQKIKKEDPNDVDMESDHSTTHELSIISRFDLPGQEAQILAAGMHHDQETSVLLLALQDEGLFSLQLGNLRTEYTPRGGLWQLQSPPSSVHLQTLGNKLLAFVATLDRELLVFQIDDRGLTLLTPIPYIFEGPFAICDSVATIYSAGDRNSQPEYLVICGLRNGSVQTLHWTEASSLGRLSPCEEFVIGNTSVSVKNDFTRTSRVLLHCEYAFCILEYPKGTRFKAPGTIHNIWITSPDQPALTQGAVSAFTQVVDSWLPRGFPGLTFGSLICIDANQLHIVNLDDCSQPRLVPRSLRVDGNPEKVIASSYLDRLIALSNSLSVSKARKTIKRPKLQGTRIPKPLVTVLDLDDDPPIKPSTDAVDVKLEDPSGQKYEMSLIRDAWEHFIGITEWIPRIGDNEHHLLIVNTKLIKRNTKLAGRLLILGLPRGGVEDERMKLKRAIVLEAPVYSLAVHPDRKSFVYCSGNELCIQSLVLSPSGIKWQTPVKAVMRSPGRYLTINDPYIYVSSARESLAVFKYADQKLIYQYGDQCARDGLHHLHIPEHSLVLASDITTTVVGLRQPPERRIDNTMTTVFEANLPVSINSLQLVTRPVWHRDPEKPHEDQAIVGSSEDGTITQFDILREGWRVLRFIQNMAERNKLVCPFKDQNVHRRHLDPSTKKPHYMHIDGNILQRVLERGAEQLIKDMLDVEPGLESHTDFDSAEARWERCKELASEVIDTEGADWLRQLVQWIRYRLRSAL